MPRDSKPGSAFGQRLKEARAAKRISQKTLGIRVGLDEFVASTRINRYERGVHPPDGKTAAMLAKALGVPRAYLYAENDRMARVILAFDALNAADQESVLKVIQAKQTRRGKAGVRGA